MASYVYSTRFVAAAPATSNTIYYTVPAGKVAVVRTMTAGWSVLARAAGVLYVLDRTAGGFIWVVQVPGGSQGSDRWEGHWVLNATDTIRASTSAVGTVYLTVSGFLLTA